MTGATLLICTYNGARRLPETLAHLAAQQVPAGVGWEVLLISNASTDDTLAAAPHLWAELGAPAPLRVFDEPRPGKEKALIRGFTEATYECICIVDDDNWLDPDYIMQATVIMQAHPKIGVLGAYAEGAFEMAPPAWFERFQAVYAVGPQAAQAGPLRQPGAYVCGAGSVVRRSGWQKLVAGDFSFTTSAKRGKVLSGAEDVELGNALRLAGYELWYDPRLRFRHYMYKERLTWEYLLRLGRSTAQSGTSSLVYFCLLRDPSLDAVGFRWQYYRNVIWMVREALRHPRRLLAYVLQRHSEANPNAFIVMRRLYSIHHAFSKRTEAFRIFGLVKALQQRLQANAQAAAI